MDLEKVQGILTQFCQNNNLNFEIKVDEKKICMQGYMRFEQIDAEGFCSFSFFKSGMAYYNILFDNIDTTPIVLELLNIFNTKTFLFFATADEYLTLDHTVFILREDDIYQYTASILDELSDTDTVNTLKPLIAQTYN